MRLSSSSKGMARALLPELKRPSAHKAVEQEMRLNSIVPKQMKQVSKRFVSFMLDTTESKDEG
jgi:hypothetical protein